MKLHTIVAVSRWTMNNKKVVLVKNYMALLPFYTFLNLEKSRSAANTINKLHVQSSNGLAEIKSKNEVQARNEL